jgi:hypothetical protein
MKEPEALLLRKRDVISWLGITDSQFRKFVDSGVIKPIPGMPDGSRGIYNKEQIKARFWKES